MVLILTLPFVFHVTLLVHWTVKNEQLAATDLSWSRFLILFGERLKSEGLFVSVTCINQCLQYSLIQKPPQASWHRPVVASQTDFDLITHVSPRKQLTLYKQIIQTTRCTCRCFSSASATFSVIKTIVLYSSCIGDIAVQKKHIKRWPLCGQCQYSMTLSQSVKRHMLRYVIIMLRDWLRT
jgi:hypothetical protein